MVAINVDSKAMGILPTVSPRDLLYSSKTHSNVVMTKLPLHFRLLSYRCFDVSHHTSSFLRAPNLADPEPDLPPVGRTTDTPTDQIRPGFDHPFVPYFSVIGSPEDGDGKGGGIGGVNGGLCTR